MGLDREGSDIGPETELRERAELLLSQTDRLLAAGAQPADALALLRELQVRQDELELQNEELRRAQIDLQISAERYSDLYDFAPVGYLSLDLNGNILRANLAAAALLGVERRALVGASLSRFIASEDTPPFLALRRRLIVPQMTDSIELRLQASDGEPFWSRLEIVTRRDPSDDSLLLQVAISNIDEHKRAHFLLERLNEELEVRVARRTEQLMRANGELLDEVARRGEAEAALIEREQTLELRVRERTQQLAGMLAVSREIASTLEADALLDIILRELQSVVSYNSCGIFLVQGEMLTLVAYRGPLSRGEVLQSQTTLEHSPLLSRVLERRAPLIVDDLRGDSEFAVEWRGRSGAFQRQLLGEARSWMGVPLMSKGRVVGVLRLDHLRPGYFDAERADLAFTLANQAGVAVENARLYAQAQNVAAIEERQRLARELHDSVAQTFYSISLSTHAATAQLAKDPEKAERHLAHVLELAGAGLTEMRALIFDLQTENLRREGLVAALRRQLDAITARNDLQVEADLGPEPEASLEAKEAVHGIAREALQNVVRHAGARRLQVSLRHDDDWIRLAVRDDGAGFEKSVLGLNTLGLRSMRERAAAAGGRVEIDTAPARGTLVQAAIPLRARGPGER